MADITQLLANAAQTNADFDFGKLNRSYWEGENQRYERDKRDIFKNGVPLDGSGQPDFAAISKTFFQKGDIGSGLSAANLALQRQQMQFGQGQSEAINSFDN